MLFVVSAGRRVEHSKEFSVATIYYIKTPLRHGRMLLWLKLLPQVVAVVVVKDVKNHNYGAASSTTTRVVAVAFGRISSLAWQSLY